jgi:glutamate synthase domain-containing protein 2
MKIYLSDSLNEKFRRIAMSVYGYGRGSLSKAAVEAFTRWCTEYDHSQTSGNGAEHSETIQGHTTSETESGINPDERQTVTPEVKSLEEDKSLNSTRSST